MSKSIAEQIQGLVENELARTDFSGFDYVKAEKAIISIVDESLDIYVEKVFRGRYSFSTICNWPTLKVQLDKDNKKICEWSVTLR